MIKQGKYFDVIKYLESKDNKGKNKINLDNNNNDDYMINNEEELVIIQADDISDIHEDNYEIKKLRKKMKKIKSEEINEKKEENCDIKIKWTFFSLFSD